MSCQAVTGCVIEDSAFANKGRLEDVDGVALLQADITSIVWSCWDPADALLINGASLTVSTVISDTLLTTGWNVDAIGYNFKHEVGDDVCVSAGVHTFEYLVTLATGQTFITRAFTPDVQAAKTS